MKLGVDLSIQDELDELHPVYAYHGEKIEPFSFFANHSGISVVRLRLWHNPYDEEGHPYGGGTNDLETFIRLAKRANNAGMDVLLDFHYSDFWVDPSRQIPPKDWKGLDYEGIKAALSQYTRETLLRLKKEGIRLAGIQIGNEISNGMVFPFGFLWREHSAETGGGYQGHCGLLKAGYAAAKEIYPEAKTVCHLEHAGSFDMQEPYFDAILKEGVEFDVIGESYYPYWHGGLPLFKDNISRLKAKFNKEIWIVEMGYEFAASRLANHHIEYKDMAGEEFQEGNPDGRIPFPLTQEGQAQYLDLFLRTCKDLGVAMVFYWEPTWIYMEGNGWAKGAGQVYCGLVPEKAENDWANETLFDFDGQATQGIDVFTQEYVNKLD